jgi:hypothetical protein
MKQALLLIITTFFVYTCANSKKGGKGELFRHSYRGNNDSIEQSLDLFSLDDSITQFTLRVENKYMDSIDGYMSNAISKDHIHYVHKRKNCRIEFDIVGKAMDTAIVTLCQCPELTLNPSATRMVSDTFHINVYR